MAGVLAGCNPFSNHAGVGGNSSFASLSRDVVRTRLENGLEVVVVPSKLAPVATSVLTYKVGSEQAPNDTRGIAHALQHLVMSGGPGLPAGQFSAVARAIGGDLSSDTIESQTRFIFTVPANEIDVALRMQAIGMKGVTADETTWAGVKAAVASEIASDKSNPQYSLYSRLRADLFQGSVYAHDALGTGAKLDSLTLADLKKFHDTWYVPNNAVLVVAGDVDPQTIVSNVKRLFGGISKRPLPREQIAKPDPVRPESLALTSHLAYGAAGIALRLPGSSSPEYPALLVLSDIIRNAPGGLDSLVSSGNAFGAGFTYDAFPDAGLGIMVGAFPQGQDGTAVKDQLKLSLAKYMNGGISRATVEAAQLRTEMFLEKQLDSVEGRALAWAESVAAGKGSPVKVLDAVANVTTAEVNSVAERYIDLGKADFATLTPAKSGPTVPLSSQGFGGPEPIDLSGPSSVLPEWARSAAPPVQPPAASKPEDTHLGNGLRLIVVPEKGSGVVGLYGLVNSNPYMQVPKGEEGVDEILGQIMSDGAGSMNKVKFRAALSEIGAEESGGTSFSLTVLSNEFSRGVDLLSQNILHPVLTKKNFDVEQKLVGQIVAARGKNPAIKARQAFLSAVLPRGDPARRQATEKEVKALTLSDVEKYYRSVYRPDMTTIVVVGNVDADIAQRVIEKYFGGWRSGGKKPNILLPSGTPNRSSFSTIKDPNSPIDQVRMAELIPMVRSSPDYYALQLGNEILSGGAYPGRFATELDSKQLPVSFLSASYISGRSRTFYLIDFAADPQVVPQVAALILGRIADLQNAAPGRTAFDHARRSLLLSLVLSETSFGEIAHGLLDRSRLDLPLDEPVRAANAYLHLTPAKVKDAMAKWVRVKDFAEVVQGPPPATK